MKKNLSMKTMIKTVSLALIIVPFASCQKENTSQETGTTAVTAETQAIAIAPSAARVGDSIYVVGTCAHGHHTDSIATSGLPATATSYLTANYAGYTFKKAYSDKDSLGNIAGYVVIINYNGKLAGLKFDVEGTFIKVLEQREGRDMKGPGWHKGGHFDDRDGKNRDTIVLAALPAAIPLWFAANYGQDTLVKAFKNKDGSYVVLSTNNSAFATVFDSTASYIKRVELPAKKGRANSIAFSALPAAAQAYLAATYPNYVFKHAFSVVNGSTLEGFAVFIDANATKYGVWFNASGSFIKATTVR